MANAVTNKRHSDSVKTSLIENATAVSINNSADVAVLTQIDTITYDRATIQVKNVSGVVLTGRVWGTLFGDPEATPVTNSKWVQVGDDITIANNSGSLKSISTTGLKHIAVTLQRASGTADFAALNCKVFLQGTI